MNTRTINPPATAAPQPLSAERAEAGARELVCRILRDAIATFRHLCRRGIVSVERDQVSFHWPKETCGRKTKGGVAEFKCGGLASRAEVIELVRFLGQEDNPLLAALGIHMRGLDLLKHLAATSHWQDAINHAATYGAPCPD